MIDNPSKNGTAQVVGFPGGEEIARALAGLSDIEWARLKGTEERRRADQRAIRHLAKELHELRRNRKGAA